MRQSELALSIHDDYVAGRSLAPRQLLHTGLVRRARLKPGIGDHVDNLQR